MAREMNENYEFYISLVMIMPISVCSNSLDLKLEFNGATFCSIILYLKHKFFLKI
jgi:hypothetical protein